MYSHNILHEQVRNNFINYEFYQIIWNVTCTLPFSALILWNIMTFFILTKNLFTLRLSTDIRLFSFIQNKLQRAFTFDGLKYLNNLLLKLKQI